jgi:hypothetical protein
MIMRYSPRFVMLLSLAALPTSLAWGANVVCNADQTRCFIPENVVLQLPFFAIAGDVILREPNSTTVSDVYRILNNFVDTGGGTGIGNMAVLYSSDDSMPLPDPSTYSANAVFITESANQSTFFSGNGTTYVLNPLAPPVFTKAFADSQIQLFGIGNNTTLSFTITNPPANPSPLTGLAFTDVLPAGLIVATPNALTSSCGGTVTATAGSNSISLSGGTLAANASCTISLSVSGTAIGALTNTTGAISSNEAPAGAPASASTSVVDLFFEWFFL